MSFFNKCTLKCGYAYLMTAMAFDYQLDTGRSNNNERQAPWDTHLEIGYKTTTMIAPG